MYVKYWYMCSLYMYEYFNACTYFMHVLYSGVCGNRVYFKCIVAMYSGGVVSI